MQQTTRQRLFYMAADYVAANAAWFVFNIIRYFTLPYNYPIMSFKQYYSMPMVLLGQIVFPLMVVLLYAISGYYNKVFFKSRLEDVLNACGISLISTAIIFFTALFNDSIDDRMGNIEMITILWALFAVITSILRMIVTHNAAVKIWRREIVFNALIVGTSQSAVALAKDLEQKHRTMGLRVLGYVDGAFGRRINMPTIDGLAVFDIADIQDAIDALQIDAVIICGNDADDKSTVNLVNKLLPTQKSIYLTPDLYHFVAARPRTSMVAGQVLIDVSQANVPESTRNLKRLGDIGASAIALLLLSPLYAAIALLIKKDSKGPIFYKQERIGYNKKPFQIIKFRTMRNDAENNGPALSTLDDPRVTDIGRILRKYRLDELPQFWNVLKGEMSLVGPRPERQYYLDQIIQRAPYYSLLHQVRPGITSWGMVKYGYASNVQQMIERMKYDLIYVENVSLAVDLKILFYTVNTVITGKGV